MKVRATRAGYYGHQVRRQGDEFTLSAAEDFSRQWMERVGAGPLDHDGDGKNGGVKNTEAGLAGMTVPQLREYAAGKGVDLGDATKKADIIAAIELAAESGHDGDGSGADDGGGSGDTTDI